MRWRAALAALVALGGLPAWGADLAVRPDAGPHTLYTAPQDGCTPNDLPDAPLRAFRDAEGHMVAFGLHFDNRALRGPDLAHLRIDCRIVLPSHGSDDPAAYDDRSWIVATYTPDGRRVAGLVHHEYHGEDHEGRCRFRDMMACWFNSVLSVRSDDAGAHFERTRPLIVASAPFPQDQNQGRHRGFFNPSNIVTDRGAAYALIATTGWDGQDDGVCLFRASDPLAPDTWRAFDGTRFSIRYADPYRAAATPRPCRAVGPFRGPVGAVVRHTGSGLWLAVFQARADAARFPVSGFYVTTSADLVDWHAPRLLLAGSTLYDDPCSAGGREIAYPSLIDETSTDRNFGTVGDRPVLTYAVLDLEGCRFTGRRLLVEQPLSIELKMD